MLSLATASRIKQIVLLAAVSFIVFELTNWQEGIWIVISTVVVAGPFSTFLTFEKAKNRFLGTLVGLMCAAGFEYYLRFNPSQLPVIAALLAFVIGFMATKPYQYFIIFITITVCLGFTYMNMPFTDFEPVSFLFARGMGVFTGIVIFFLMQKIIFGDSTSKIELLEEGYQTLQKLSDVLETYFKEPTLYNAVKGAAAIHSNTANLSTYLANTPLVFSTINPETIYAQQVFRLNQRAIQLLIDDADVDHQQLHKILRIVRLKLNK